MKESETSPLLPSKAPKNGAPAPVSAAKTTEHAGLRQQVGALEVLADEFELPATAQKLEHALAAPKAGPGAQSAPKKLTPIERRALWKRVFEEARLTLEDLHPQRVGVAYRIVRQMLRAGKFTADEPLVKLSEASWQSVLPPAVPQEWLDEQNEPKSDYQASNKEHDPRLHAYVERLDLVSRQLSVTEGAKKRPQDGVLGMIGMLETGAIRVVFPSRYQIAAYEMLIIDETLEQLTKHGVNLASRNLVDNYGWTPVECLEMVGLARAEAVKRVSLNLEEDRALMVLRQEDLLRRARRFGDIRGEQMALKQLCMIMGLTKAEPEDTMDSLLGAFRSVAKPNLDPVEGKRLFGG